MTRSTIHNGVFYFGDPLDAEASRKRIHDGLHARGLLPRRQPTLTICCSPMAMEVALLVAVGDDVVRGDFVCARLMHYCIERDRGRPALDALRSAYGPKPLSLCSAEVYP